MRFKSNGEIDAQQIADMLKNTLLGQMALNNQNSRMEAQEKQLPAAHQIGKMRIQKDAAIIPQITAKDHIKNVEDYTRNNIEAIRLAKDADGPSYDPLYNEAADCFETYAFYERIIRNWSDSDISRYYGAKYCEKMKAEYQRRKDEAWAAYQQYPIVLSKETLQNPYAAQYADLLSKRTPTTEERKQMQAVINDLNDLLYSNNGCSEDVCALADPVRCALMAKLPGICSAE